MTARHYTIRHCGYKIRRTGGIFFIYPPSGATKKVSVKRGSYSSGNITLLPGGDIWINKDQVVKQGGALCYTATFSGYTFTRAGGSDRILINGPGIRQTTSWNASFSTFVPGGVKVSMAAGCIRVGDRLVVRGGVLALDHAVMVEQDPVEAAGYSTRNADPTPPTPIPEATRPNTTTMASAAASSSDHQSPIFTLTHGDHTVARRQDYFEYSGRRTRNLRIGLESTTSGDGYHFEKGNVWFDKKQVVADSNRLNEGDGERPQPSFDLWGP